MLTQYGEPGNLRTARDYWHLVGPQSPGSATNTRASTLREPLLRSVWFLSAPLHLLSECLLFCLPTSTAPASACIQTARV